MPPEVSNTQAVFLIDVSLCRDGGTKWDEAISLGVFRILSFLNCQQQAKTKTKALRWGYKLFDIDEKSGNVESRSGFCDFKIKTFQEFEKGLKKCFQRVKEADVFMESQRQEKKKKGFLVSSHPSLCLSKRLTEIVHDFSWEMPDVGSPVKGKKTQRWFETAESFNFVFLMSRIPCDKKSLRHYCNKVVMDKNVFIDAFMPPLLRKQFYEEHKIHLHWIDVGRYQVVNEESGMAAADVKSYEIVKRSLRMVGGLLIPFHSLITHLPTTQSQEHHSQQASSSCSQDGSDDAQRNSTSDEGAQRRDHETILLSSFACMSVCSALLPCGRGRQKGTPGLKSADESTTKATLIFEDQDKNGGGESQNVGLKLVPMIKEAPKRQQTSSPQQIEVRTSDNSDGACILVTQASRTSHPSHTTTTPHFQMRACMEKSQVRKLGGNLVQHFLCFVAESASAEQKQALSSLLQTLHSRQQALILSVRVDKETCPYLAVLEGSSSCTAHLTYLSLGVTLQVEKHLTLQQQPAAARKEGEGEESPGKISLEQFKNRTAEAIAAAAHTPQKLRGNLQGVTVTERASSSSCCSSADSRGLWTGVLNPWHMAGSVPRIQLQLNTLADRLQERSGQSKARRRVLGDLKQAYRRENQPPFLLLPYQQSTPAFPSTSSSFLRTDSSMDRSNSSQENLSASEGRKSGKHESILTRGRLMVNKARSLSLCSQGQDEVDGDVVMMPAKPEVIPLPCITQADVQSEEDLSHFVQQEYTRALETDTDLEHVAHAVVSFTLQFMTSQEESLCPQRCGATFLEERLLKPHQDMRAGLHRPTPRDEEDSERTKRLKELKLQVLLRLEVESMCSSVEQIDQSERQESQEQVVELLRSLMFALGPKLALEFLNTVVLHSYLTTLPELLVTLYDELMQPLPRALKRWESVQTAGEQPSSDSSASPSALGEEASTSVASSDQSITSPRKRTRSSVLLNPVLPTISNKRQIEVKAPPPAKKAKGNRGKKGASKGRSKTEKSRSPAKHRGGKRARRNLFDTDLSKVPSGKDHGQASRSSRRKHPPSSDRHRGHSKTFVAETPHHRQRGRLSRDPQQGDNQPRDSTPAAEVEVIQESPFKDAGSDKSTPGRYKAPRRVLRSTFYSAGSGRHSRSLSRALENPDNISGRHHVPHLEASKSGCLAEALGLEAMSSPRRQVTALLNPRGSSVGGSPELKSPAHNTRSRTPKQSGRHLLHDSRSMPSFPSAAKILDFTSPVKASAAVRSPALTSPHRASRRRGGAVLVEDSSSRQTDSTGGLTPTKGRRDAGQTRTPVKHQSAPQQSAQGSTPKKVAAGMTTPQKPGRGASPHSCSGSSSRQSSLTNGVSPTRRSCPFRDMQSAQLPASGSEPTTFLTPTKPRQTQTLQSPIRTPTKPARTHSSPARSQQFLSPVKTPSKSILRHSPVRRSPARQGGVRTPQKSPRVSFRVGPSSAAGGEHAVKSPDYVYKSPRRTRQWSGDSGQPPSSSPCAHVGKPFEEQLLSGSGDGRLFREDSKVDDSSHSFALAGPCRAAVSRKRSSALSEVDSLSSSSKRQKLDSSVMSGVSKPTLFSENAMDSYFSACSDDVFLGASSEQLLPMSSLESVQSVGGNGPESPLFKGKIEKRESSQDTDSGRVFDFAAKQSSPGSLAGSQGFEAMVIEAGDDEPPSSPTFNTSPVSKKCSGINRMRGSSSRSQLGSPSGKDVRAEPQNKLHPEVGHHRDASSPNTACPFHPGMSSGSAQKPGSEGTPLRVKGVMVPCSPKVSNASLALLINSPLLLNPEAQNTAQAGAEQGGVRQAGQEHAVSPGKKKSRKKLEI